MDRSDRTGSAGDRGTILCCGDALIDLLPRELPDGTPVLLPVTGGAIFNTAIALGRLGLSTRFLSALSTDMFGRRLEADLAEAGVDTALSMRSDRPTSLAFIELIDGNARYRFYDDGTAGRMLSEKDIPDLPDEVEVLHFGGLSLVKDPCAEAYETLLTRESPRRVISLDPNIRAAFVDDHTTHRARIERLIAKSDIVKVSDDDLAWIALDEPAQEVVARWIAGGTSIVVVTKGGQGASAFTAEGELTVNARKVNVIDTVGAGDGFNAGLLAGLHLQGRLTKSALPALDRKELSQALELGSEVASVIVSRQGANAPWRYELGHPLFQYRTGPGRVV